MQVLLTTIGSRGDVQPVLALALELRALGHRPRLCAAPNFRVWVESFGLDFFPNGPDLHKMTGGSVPGKPVLPSSEQLQQLAVQMIRDQFDTIAWAAAGCDLIVAAGALQIATRSIAEAQNIPYVFAAYCPAVLPSAIYPPPKTGGSHSFALSEAENLQLWKENEAEFNARFRAVLNDERAKAGLSQVLSVREHIFRDRPWLAADPVLAPAAPSAGMEVVQTGAWMLSDPTDLPDELEEFLASGLPPVYLGFGSMRAFEQTGRVLVEAARSLGLRSVLSQGWANLIWEDAGKDWISIAEVNHKKLLPRVAAVVHHGGAGTTTAAAQAGKPQVIIPNHYDQFYWAHRVDELGVGVQGPVRDDLSVEALAVALDKSLRPEVAGRAQALAGRMEQHGAHLAAERLANFMHPDRG